MSVRKLFFLIVCIDSTDNDWYDQFNSLGRGKQIMKRDEMRDRSCSVSACTLSSRIISVADNAARTFGALRFWFFGFIFTPLPIRKKRLA